MTPVSGTLPVPGATLYYETRGSGPVLLLIPGGAGDAGMYEGIARHLAERFTVVSYDPRGLSRSPLDGPLADQEVEVWSEDAHRLLETVSPESDAYVLGNSSGAIVALDLLARHPDRLRRVVAHEPPLVELLEDPAPYRTLFAEVREISRAQGVSAAMAHFSGDSGSQETELPPEIREMLPRMHANMPVFLEHLLCPFSGSTPKVTALKSKSLVLAAGRDSRHQIPFSGPAARLAELTGSRFVEFPGGHLGCTEHPQKFAEQLLAVLN